MSNEENLYQIRWAEVEDWTPAMNMIWKTFLKFEGNEYTPEGIRNFLDFITDEELFHSFLQGKYLMLVAVDKAYGVMIENLKAEKIEPMGLRMATDCEIEINDIRNAIREEEVRKIEEDGANYQSSVYYLDTISEVERMGDFIINISQALEK